MHQQRSDSDSIFSTANLPSLPQTLVQLLEECNDHEAELPEVAAIVAKDVTIAAKILNLANSAFLGTRAKFLSIEQAVIYLGIDTVRNLAISVSVHESFSEIPEAKNFSLSEFWYHSLLSALIAKELAEIADYENPAEAYLAGLLHDIGKCLFSAARTEQYDQLLGAHPDKEMLRQQESRLFGLDHAKAGSVLMEHWQLEPSLAEAIENHHQNDPPHNTLLTKIVYAANALANEDQDSSKPLLATLGIDHSPAAMDSFMGQLSEQVIVIAETLGIGTVRKAEKKEGEKPDSKAHSALRSETADIALLTGVLDNLVRANTSNRIYQVLEESLNILFDIKKSILLLQDEDTDRFSAAGSFRNKIARSLRETLFYPHQERVLQNCLATPGTVLVEHNNLPAGENQLKFLFEVFGEDLLNISSFRIANHQTGILVTAPPTPGKDLTRRSQLVMLLLSHIGHRLQLEQLQKQHARDQVRQNIRAMEEISRTVAHEISGPINIIQNYLLLLQKDQDLPEQIIRQLNIIDKEIDRVANIAGQLHNLSMRPVAPRRVQTDIVALIKESVELFRTSLPPESGIQVEFTGDESIEQIWSIPEFVQQILVNLLTNSLEAVGGKGRISVGLEVLRKNSARQTNEIALTVADTGPGIDPDIIGTIFQPGCTSKAGTHTGLGLAIVAKLVNDLGGSVLHRKNNQNETEFVVYLPMDFRK